ncbi:MAG: SIMPL domain-containing protein [Candidatus Bathyarchaeota archaeon]|nr:SIMPL domain-containing protein [Candidatus Bathyarchaeota archaeon]
MGIIARRLHLLPVINMEKTRQAVSVLAVCASILLAGMVIAYKPGMVAGSEFRFPTGVPPALGATGFTTGATTDAGTALKTLSISGTGVVYVKADKATVYLGVYTEDRLASRAIEDNAAAMTAVIDALKQLGFTDEDMQTTSYGVTPNYNWDIREVVGYQVTNILQVKITDLTKVGPAIDAAASAGANRVDSISFGISDQTAAAMKLQAYTAAISDAKAKSDVITSGLGIKIAGVQSVTESSYYPMMEYRSYDVASSSGKATTPVLQGNLSVSVTLSIVYLIEPA